MNDRMNLEIKKAINTLRSSMPSPNTNSNYYNLLRLAIYEIRPMYFSISIIVTVLLGIIGTGIMSAPMLTSFCTAPVPILLIFADMYGEIINPCKSWNRHFVILSHRCLLLNVDSVGILLAVVIFLTAIIYNVINSISFVRAILCGLMSLTIISGILLLCAGKVREMS